MGTPKWIRVDGKERRHLRIKKKIFGTSSRPRLCVRRSLNHTYAQLIDDDAGKTIVSASTTSPDVRGKLKSGGNVKASSLVGEALAERAISKGLTKVVFDRAGYRYHGRVKALAEAARKKGLQF